MKKSIIVWSVATLLVSFVASPFLSPLLESLLYPQGILTGFSTIHAFTENDPLETIYLYYHELLHEEADALLFVSSIVLVGSTIALYMLWSYSKHPSPVSQNSILGNSKIIDTPHERKSRNDTWNGKGEPKSAGLVYGFEKGHYLFDSKTPHTFTAGKTGSGKSRFLVLETLHLCLAAKHNVIVTDIKNELVELTGDKASETARVFLLDLENPLRGQQYSPLDIIVDYAEANDTQRLRESADQLASDLVKADERNPFFSNAARGLLSACFIAIATEDISREQKNMASVCAFIDAGTTAEDKDPSAPLKDYFRRLGVEHPAFSPASEFLSDGGTTAGKNVLSTVKVALRPFSSPGIQWLTAKSTTSLDDLIKNHSAIYLHVLGKDNPYNVILTCFFNQFWCRARTIADANGGKLPIPTTMICDEWGNVPYVSALSEIVTLGRSYGLSWNGFCQNVSQMNAYNKPGDNNAGREEILSNVGIKVALSLGDETDRRWFTALCGKRGVMTQGASNQKSQGRYSSSQSTSERSDDLIHEWDWTHRSPDSDGAIVVKSKENNAKNRNGVFRMPLADATKTPAKSFFDLGSPDYEQGKRLAYRAKLNKKAASENLNIPLWKPNFAQYASQNTRQQAIEADEFSAWD